MFLLLFFNVDSLLGYWSKLPLVPYSKWISAAIDLACGNPFGKSICTHLIGLASGFDLKHMNQTRVVVFLKHEPGGTSLRTLDHWSQVYNRGGPAEYDYGMRGNLRRYGTHRSPVYDFRKITNKKIVLLHGSGDWLADPKDVTWLTKQLPDLLDNYRVPRRQFNHLDFILAQDLDFLVNPQVLYWLIKSL